MDSGSVVHSQIQLVTHQYFNIISIHVISRKCNEETYIISNK